MNFQSLRRTASLLAVSAVVALTAGCASPSKPDAMVASVANVGTKHAQTASVVVAGGSETSSMGKSQISNEAFREALVTSIEKNKSFSSVVKGSGGDYQLAVTVVSMDQPSFGLTFTVKMEAAWSLKKADGTVVMQESIKSEGTATTSDAFAGVERLRLANEAAARNNIAAGLTRIGQLNF